MRHVPDHVAVAREQALVLDEEWSRRFDAARAATGRMPCNGAGYSVIETTAWGRESWMRLAERVGSALSEDDWIMRVDRAPGKKLRANLSPADIRVDDEEAFAAGLRIMRLPGACCSNAAIKDRPDFIAPLV